ncbi:hypothetical protein HPB52_009409 [Rhipicephalus sanguineus]|uniref:Uncharacterized protein n=1 Tax=Rhipicephalus sanguineus TaxID=34632 RepID=A0A9D4PR40_RHISA|nr:hypothetical protein HPB52_009409 [Rhipicephalus sanguineus]
MFSAGKASHLQRVFAPFDAVRLEDHADIKFLAARRGLALARRRALATPKNVHARHGRGGGHQPQGVPGVRMDHGHFQAQVAKPARCQRPGKFDTTRQRTRRVPHPRRLRRQTPRRGLKAPSPAEGAL